MVVLSGCGVACTHALCHSQTIWIFSKYNILFFQTMVNTTAEKHLYLITIISTFFVN